MQEQRHRHEFEVWQRRMKPSDRGGLEKKKENQRQTERKNRQTTKASRKAER
ncbi:hypothetical protein BC567DRAFT_219956 [Phyllosticta citribraziliensis]